MSETLLVKKILLYLEQRRDLIAWRNNVGGRMMAGRFVKFGHKGHSDIFGVLDGGKFFAIEAKVGNNKQSEEQMKFQKQIEELGGIYILAYDIEDVIIDLPQYDGKIFLDFQVKASCEKRQDAL